MTCAFWALGLFLTLAPSEETKSREFRFTYEFTLSGIKVDDRVRIWAPLPPNTDEQRIAIVEQTAVDGTMESSEGKTAIGNGVLHYKAIPSKDGKITIRVVYEVNRQEVRGESKTVPASEATHFLKPDTKVPAHGKYLSMIKDKQLPADRMELSRALYDLVNGELRYSKEGTGWGRGDVNWVCDSKYGNCTDFHSLFIALARSRQMPGKFEIGFALPEKRGRGEIAGYHCWAKIQPTGKGWFPVDISMANQNPKLKEYCFGNLSENRVLFFVGRDIDLFPKQNGPPLNFFIYPYVEVNDVPYPAEKIQKKFAFEDVEAVKK